MELDESTNVEEPTVITTLKENKLLWQNQYQYGRKYNKTNSKR